MCIYFDAHVSGGKDRTTIKCSVTVFLVTMLGVVFWDSFLCTLGTEQKETWRIILIISFSLLLTGILNV